MADKLVVRILRMAQADPPGEEQIESYDTEAIVDTLTPMMEDAQKVASFLEELFEFSEERAASYLEVIQAKGQEDENFAQLWETLADSAEAIKAMDDEGSEEDDLTFEEDESEDDTEEDEEDFAEGEPAAIHHKAEDMSEEEGDQFKQGYKQGMDSCKSGKQASDGEIPEEVKAKGESFAQGYKKAMEECVKEAQGEQPETVSLADVEAASHFDLVLFGEDSDNPFYSVFADGKPAAEIQLQDQPNAEAVRDVFVSEDYPAHLVETMEQQGAESTLQSVNARFYAAVVDHSKVAEKATRQAEAKLEDEYAERLAALKENFLNTVNLATMAANKGQFVKNSLRRELKRAVKQAGVVNASAVIDDAWERSATDFFHTIFAKAEEWMNYSPEALHEVTAEIIGTEAALEHENHEADVELESMEDSRQAARQAAAAGFFNVPIRTRQVRAHDKIDQREHYRRTMNFGSRMFKNMGARH